MLIAFFAIVIGLGGAYAARRLLQQQQPPPVVAKVEPKPPAPEIIPLAAADLPIGRVITTGDMLSYPFSPEGRNRLPSVVLNNSQQIIGRMLRVKVPKGDAFQPDSFYPEGMEPTAAERVRPGRRAVTITVAVDGALAGQAVPGSIVDVLFRSTPKPAEDIPETTKVLADRVSILAIGDNATPGLRGGLAKDAKTSEVTLDVSPEQARNLSIAEGRGNFSLVLRNAEDESKGQLAGVTTLRELLDVPPKPEPFITDIYRSGKRTTLYFRNARVEKEVSGGNDFNTPRIPAPSSPAPALPADPDRSPAPAAPQTSTPAGPQSPVLDPLAPSMLLPGLGVSLQGPDGLPLPPSELDDVPAPAASP
jgi:pilus assembly protein CpaB